ncbi:hypothetical protein HYPSUDRAFT_70161 [Hypholoma sublateritium FD-334 SS-4]|uniref:6-phosphogluconolactonase n=1 Tax=Hypholoma sublateritium (strain FD-334 SS-4) TaxID=945553 RepID=A0A0D2PD23_HYPSF|nr:hypothetical protein HYPSUDRAFT_70161 [Hypholoma sublateritium FD-334 SS-4]
MVYRILVGSYSDEIVTLAFDPDARTLEATSALKVGHHPSWLTAHPAHPSLVRTGLEQSDGRIITVSYDESGKGTILSDVPSGGQDPCCLLALEDEILVANYSSGTIGILPLDPKNAQPASALSTIQLRGTGPNAARQEGSHPHQVLVHAENEELLVADLGADIVHRLQKTTSGSWELRGHVGFAAGGGPRHVALHDGALFTLLELGSKIVRHRFPPLPALPKLVASVPTMAHPPPTPNDMLAAEVLIPAPNVAFPTPYLYLSNRNDPSPEGDTIAVFSISAPDSLDLVAEFRTGLRHLRGLVFGGPDARYVVAGGANGGGVKVFERINGGTGFALVAALDSVNAPTAFLWL